MSRDYIDDLMALTEEGDFGVSVVLFESYNKPPFCVIKFPGAKINHFYGPFPYVFIKAAKDEVRSIWRA